MLLYPTWNRAGGRDEAASKNSKKRRDAKTKKTKSVHTTLAQHKRVKKTLVPRLNTVSPVTRRFSHWTDDRVHELRWACLVRGVLPRHGVLEVFREVAVIAREFVDSTGSLSEIIPSQSNLAERHSDLIPRIVKIVTKYPLGYAALRPLISIESLPGRDLWIAALGMEPDPNELNALADAMPEFFGHQTEHLTGVRWLVVLYGGFSHKIHYQATMAERMDEIIHYPNHGDLRKVRPLAAGQLPPARAT